MKKKIVLAVSTIVLVLGGAAQAEPRPHRDFTKVSASAGTDVEISIGEEFRVDVTGRDAQRIVTRVANGTLIVEPVRGWSWRGHRDALVRVTMPRVEGLEASSGAEIRARGVNGGGVSLEASSGAELSVAGVCASFDADASSGARIAAADLRCDSGRVDVSSGANVHVYASNRIDVDASSGGNVVAHGNPGIGDIDLSSGGSLRRAREG